MEQSQLASVVSFHGAVLHLHFKEFQLNGLWSSKLL
jgi:hypothetical protein